MKALPPNERRPVLPLLFLHFVPAAICLVFFTVHGAENQAVGILPKEFVDSAELLSKERIQSIQGPVLVSTDSGRSWKTVGEGLPKATQASFLCKSGDGLVMASDNNGIFLLGSGEKSWKSIGEKLPNQKITSLMVDNKTIYAAVYQKGIYVSTDRGNQWTSFNFNLPNRRVKALTLCADRVFAGTDAGIYELEKGASAWVNRFEGPQIVSLNRGGSFLVAGTSSGTLRSLDNGRNWTWIHQKGAAHNTAILSNLSVIMNISSGLFISDDRGNAWTEARYEPRDGSYVYDMERVNGIMVMSNNYGVFQSTDEGKSWRLIHETSGDFFFDFMVDHGMLFGAKRF